MVNTGVIFNNARTFCDTKIIECIKNYAGYAPAVIGTCQFYTLLEKTAGII